MLQGLKIAVKRQKKLLVIFFITIFLPAVSLSIFGVVALRNEKFRIENQVEDEQLQAANNFKDRISSKLLTIEERLINLAGHPAFRLKDYPVIKELMTGMFERDSLVGIVFLLYENEDPFFPMFQSEPENIMNTPGPSYDYSLQQRIINAEDAEFIRNDYQTAASIYYEAFSLSANSTIKALMLNLAARNLVKAGNFSRAALTYERIISDYPEEITESGLPLELWAKMQRTECYTRLGDNISAIENDLVIYEGLLGNKWTLSESRFKTYASLINERLVELLSVNTGESTENLARLEELEKRYRYRIEQWETIGNLKLYLIPDLPVYLTADSPSPSSVEFSKKIGNEDYLALATKIYGQNRQDNVGILATCLNNNYLQDNILPGVIEEVRAITNTAIYVTSLSGDSISGSKNNDHDAITTVSLFDNNFPPWRLELVYAGGEGPGEISIFSSFYFWTIITLIIILVFGAALIARLVAREMEILKIKSDFVSSVSHEFKTPLTSIKSLAERIKEGKVTEQGKLKQYISIIASDTERLIRLVSNILSFSKIEEGKKIYKKEKTDLANWLRDVIDTYREESIERGININVQIDNDLPAINIDRDSMAQAIFNLLDNAAKFSFQEKETVVKAEKNESSIIIRIKDKGIGIKDEERDKIFEKFYRGESAVKYLIKGTGLGLALVKYTVEAHNGTIVVDSEVGKGSTFTITLPL
jgi:signal transduction histidine kinase